MIGGLISGLFGSKNEFKADPYQADRNAYEYGGRSGGADADVARARQMGDSAQARGAENIDYAQANRDRAAGLQAREGLSRMASQAEQRASGQVRSIAQMQADRQMGQAMAQQASMAASARGPAALALAQQGAANNTATAAGSISGQAQINAASERQAAEAAAMGAYGQMRQGDLGSQAQSAQQSLAQAQMNAAQRQQNDQYQMATEQAAYGVRGTQLQGGMAREGQAAASRAQADAINAGVAAQNAQTNQRNAEGFIGAITGPLTKAAGLARGGPAMTGTPYLVGEKGPELVIPSRDSFVIPAHHTEKIVGRALGGIMLAAKAPAAVGALKGKVGAAGLDAPSPTESSQPGGAGMMSPKRGGVFGDLAPIGVYAPGASYVPPQAMQVAPIQMRADGGPMEGPSVLPLYEPPGKMLQQTPDGHAYYATSPSAGAAMTADGGSGIASMQSAESPPLAMRAPIAPKKSPEQARKMTPDEMKDAADRMMKEMRAYYAAQMAAGPAVKVSR